MSVETQMAPVAAEQPVDAGVQDVQQGVEGISMLGNGNENGMQGEAPMPVPEAELHRACAEGNLDGVRAVLSNGLEALETLDMSTGCTPIVLAIRANHYDVVRELLSAGAIVPPPGLTHDQGMLSILYPQPMYGMPPYMQPVPEFYPGPAGQMYGQGGPAQGQQPGPNGFHPMSGMHGHAHGHGYPHGGFPGPGPGPAPFQPRRDRGNSIHRERTEVAPGQPNLPPSEVARMIPCRNFPNCKYGNNCAFFHPNRAPFFAPGQPGPNGFAFDPQQQGGFPAAQGGPNGMYPPSFQYSQPQSQPQQAQQQPPAHEQQQQQEAPLEASSAAIEGSAEDASQSQQPSQPPPPPPFVSFQPGQPIPVPHPSDQAQFGASPLSPSALAGSLPSIPPAEAFFAQSPPGNFPPPFVPMDARRQSFGQFGAPGLNPAQRPYGGPGHGKKPSFSGGPRPFARGSGPDFGKWKDGVPPNCVFFGQGRCRNGDMCKFPHIDAEGNDCRNPEVIKGTIPSMPTTAPRPQRAPRVSMGHGSTGPAFDQRQNQLAFLQQQRAAVQQAHNQASQPAAAGASAAPAETDSAPASATPTAAPSTTPTPTNDSDMAASQTLVGSVSDLGAAKEGKSVVSAIAEESASPSAAATPAAPSAPASNTGASASALANAPTAPAAANLPAKPLGTLPPVARSASQPGVQRVHANGLHSRMPFHPAARRGAAPNGVAGRHFAPGMNGRSASAEGQMRGPRGPAAHANANANAQANASGASGNGHGNGNGNGNGAGHGSAAQAQQGGKASAGAKAQRVPRADEFPALGGLGGAAAQGQGENKVASPSFGAVGRTAAQVLSEPAPVKAIPSAPAVERTASKQSDEDSITMDSDNESDGVIISCKPSSTQQSAPASGGASPVKRAAAGTGAPLSFASIAGALASSNSTSTGASASAPAAANVESASVAVKAA